MQTNGITVPDAGSTTQYFPDPIGGWMYIATTTVSVQQKALADIQNDLESAKAQLVATQAIIDELSPQVADFQTAIKALPAPVAAVAEPS